MFLLAGHIDLSQYETQLAVALSTGEAIPALRNLPGSIGQFLRLTAGTNDIDMVLVDMSPSVGALNQCALMSSDYFIVPTSPDYYCDQAIRSLSAVLPRWHSQVESFRDTSLQMPFPQSPPVFIGIVSQRYRPRSGNPAASFQRWIDRIKQTVISKLVPSLSPAGMAISKTAFVDASPADTPYNLANIADFNSLIAQSQLHNVPVFALSDAQIGQGGNVLVTMRENRDNFRATFERLAQTVRQLTGR